MKDRLQGVRLEGGCLRLAVGEPVDVELHVLAVATRLRVFERYPVPDEVALEAGTALARVVRNEVEELLGRDGWGGLRERSQRSPILARIVLASTGRVCEGKEIR